MSKPAIGLDVFEFIHAHQAADTAMRQNLIESLIAERDRLQAERDHWYRIACAYIDADDQLQYARALAHGTLIGEA